MRIRTWVAILMFIGCFNISMLRLCYSIILLVASKKAPYNIRNDCLNPDSNATETTEMPANKLSPFLRPIQVAIVFAAYDLGASFTVVFAKLLGNQFGYTKYIGSAMLCSAVLTMLTPIGLIFKNVIVLVLIRFFKGALLSPIYPMMNILMTNWSPTNERNVYGVILYGSTIGTFTTILIYGNVILNLKYLTMYLTGLAVIIWCMAWFCFVRDDPTQHELITLQELDEISNQRTLSSDIFRIRRRTLWREIIKSSKIRALVMLMWCNTWNLTFFMDYIPMYYDQMTSEDFNQAITLSSLPLVARLVGSVICLPVIKCLLITNKLSITFMRKIFTVFSHVIPGTIALATITTSCIEVINVTKMIVIMGFNGAFVGGGFVNALDLTPHFAKHIYGPILSFISVSGVMVPLFVGCVLEYYDQHIVAWSIIMGICGSIYVLGGVVYIIFGSASIQSWDITYARQACQSISRLYIDDDDCDY